MRPLSLALHRHWPLVHAHNTIVNAMYICFFFLDVIMRYQQAEHTCQPHQMTAHCNKDLGRDRSLDWHAASHVTEEL
jgi:hypothetical protein